MKFEEEFPLMSKRWKEEAPYEMGEDLKKAFRDTCLDKKRVREAIENAHPCRCRKIGHCFRHALLTELGL